MTLIIIMQKHLVYLTVLLSFFQSTVIINNILKKGYSILTRSINSMILVLISETKK